MKKLSIVLLFVLLSIALIYSLSSRGGARVEFVNASGRVAAISVEVADTPQEQERGLMHRAHLGDDEGMLFVFRDDATRYFWMKDTPIPLDMVFVNGDGRVVDINYNATPNTEDVYASKEACRYVIEVNGGFCNKHSIRVGDLAKIDLAKIYV